MVATLDEYLDNPQYKINFHYYINKHINAALGRIFSTFGVTIQDWYTDIPKGLSTYQESKTHGLHHFYNVTKCFLCSNHSNQDICNACLSNPSVTLILLGEKLSYLQKDVLTIR
jgi:hypothetical protein